MPVDFLGLLLTIKTESFYLTRGNFKEAIEILDRIKELEVSSLAVKGKHSFYMYDFLLF